MKSRSLTCNNFDLPPPFSLPPSLPPTLSLSLSHIIPPGETRNNAKSIRMNAPLSSATSSRSDGTISNLGLHGDNLDQTRLGTYGLAIGNSRTNIGNGDRSSAGVSGRTTLDEASGRLGFPAPDSNTNTASDLLGLGGIGSARESSGRQSGNRNDLVGLLNVAEKRQSLRRSNKGLRVRGGTSPGSSRFKWNSPLSTSSFSSSSSSSSTSFTPSSPSSMYSSLSSSAASASSSSPLLSAASRILSTSIASSASETQRAGGVARSWSIALQRGTPSTSSRQIFNPRSRSSSMLSSRSLLRDVALDKNRMIYNTREQLSSPRSNRNNPLGLRLDNPTSNDTPRQEGPTQDHTSYSIYPFTLSRPRYSSTAGRGTASRNHQQHQLRVRQQRLQHHQQLHAQQRRNVFGSQQHRQKQRLGNQRQDQARQPLPPQQLRGRHQLQRHSPNTQTSELHDALTKQVLDNIEVRATPARRLTPGGPLRIGLDINVRHGVYPIDSLKQP